MPEEVGWEPDNVAVKRSEVESKIADIVEEDSLSVINEMANTDGKNEKKAAMMRKMRRDLRIDTTDAEQKSAQSQAQVIMWVIIGISVMLSFGGFALISLL
ncbi:MAG: hypothetical protein VX320_06340 [Candidatus Thermoplasmatota archaeon]|nr:hypothetical protein [Candidatus Thermoplasmatota archaeon]